MSDMGFTVIPVLEFLWGRKFTQLEENYLAALRPSSIEIIRNGTVNCDCRSWRVRVYLEDETILRIEQEVNVSLEGGYTCGWDLGNALKHGTDPGQEPPQVIINTRAIRRY